MTADIGPRTTAALASLTGDEKAALSAGDGFFTIAGVPRLGIGPFLTTDGPNGARGSSLFGSGEARATCLPCGSALGATWDPDLVEELGVLLGREARTKAARALLAPTVNLHRSPLAGRNFECFSEDPLLSGVLAAAYVRGVQSQGVMATVKHFVANEAETDRRTSNSVVDERALRELYLVPFEHAVRHGRALGVMTSYNRLNGDWCNNQEWLLRGVLRHEWGFDGIVMTDWVATADTVAAARAGLDVEMPGGHGIFGATLAAAVAQGRVDESVLEVIAGRVLSTFERLGAWDDEPVPERSVDRPDHRGLARRAAVGAMTLLVNEPVDGTPVLPLDVGALRRVAVIGPNAGRAQIMGGGSANLRPFHRTSPLDALRARLGDAVEVVHEPGCDIDRAAPLLSGAAVVSPRGEPGFTVEVFGAPDWSGDPVRTTTRDTSRLLLGATELPATPCSTRARARFTPSASGPHTFELIQVGGARVRVDGRVVLDGIADPPAGRSAYFGLGAGPATAVVELEAGRAYDLVVEHTTPRAVLFTGSELGVRPPLPPDGLDRAVAAAAVADVAVVVVGTNDDWESEGHDRRSLALPGDQDGLVAAVAAANPRTVVVVNTGAPVTMPWVGDVAAVVQSWLGGQEMAEALVDVLTGAEDPGGRLPTSFPLRIEHTPAFGYFPGDNGEVRYAEGLFMGYRWYTSRHLPVLFPFGHGLSYTTFAVGAPEVAPGPHRAGTVITVQVPVTNTGARKGSQVVQAYVRPHRSRLVRPDRELKAFAKVALDPGERRVVRLMLDERAFAYWDPGQPDRPEVAARALLAPAGDGPPACRAEPGWVVEPGEYDVVIATSVDAPAHTVTVTVA